MSFFIFIFCQLAKLGDDMCDSGIQNSVETCVGDLTIFVKKNYGNMLPKFTQIVCIFALNVQYF